MSAVSSGATAASTAVRRGLLPEDLLHFRWLGEVALDPQGTRVAYTVREVDAAADGYQTHLMVRELDGDAAVRVSSGRGNASSPRWSPDGQRLAYSWREADASVVRVWSRASGETEEHALGAEPMTALDWSPDGRRLAGVRWTPQRHARDGGGPRPGIPAPSMKVIRRLRYKQDGVGFVHDRFTQIWVLELDSGALVQLTASECDYSEPAWSRRGDRLAFIGLAREQDRALGQGQIFVCDYPGGGPVRLLPDWVGACRSPVWGDDDRHIAFAGHQHPAPTNRRIFMTPHLADVEAGSARELGNLDQEVGNYAVSDSRAGLSNITVKWPAGDRWIYFLLTVEGAAQLCRIDAAGSFERVVAGPTVAFDYSPAAGDIVAYGEADPTSPGDLFVRTPQGSRRLTALNPWLGDREVVRPQERTFAGLEGANIQGWLMTPPDFDSSKRYPAIVYVHCSMFSWDFSHEFQCLVSAGYVLNFFNVRGTTAGYGQAWTRASEGDQGGQDYRETMLGVDALCELPFVDEARLGVTGGSCGGFMTNWIVGHSDRFAAAVTQRSISNQISFFGTSDIGPECTLGETGTHALADLDAAWRQSPIAYAADIRTPLLIIHSDEDHRCPLEQAEQLFATLRWLGREVELVVFEGESHGLSRGGRPGNRIERIRRIEGWFERYLGSGPS